MQTRFLSTFISDFRLAFLGNFKFSFDFLFPVPGNIETNFLSQLDKDGEIMSIFKTIVLIAINDTKKKDHVFI
jgi:hypothetical protein